MSDNLVPDSLPFETDVLFVCRSCSRIYGDVISQTRGASRPGQRQRCDCQPTDGRVSWPDYHFPEAISLCRCCGRRALPSGSRWSIWFCRDCRRAIQTINRDCRSHVIPVGRHSLLEQIRLDEDAEDREVPAFVAELGDWFARIERLEAHAWQVVQSNLRELRHSPSLELSLTDYLEQLATTADILRASVLDLGRTFHVPAFFLTDAAGENR